MFLLPSWAQTQYVPDMSDSVTESLKKARPLFVVAPTARNGVTLIQRLLNSSKKTVIFGENPWFMHHICLLYRNFLQFEQHSQLIAGEKRRFLNEGSEFWSSNLNPDPHVFKKPTLEFLKAVVDGYQQQSLEMGFSDWGLKQPLSLWRLFETLRGILPQARYVYIHRDLIEVAQSYKGRGWLGDKVTAQALALQWQANLLPVLKQNLENLHVIRYENLVKNPGHEVKKLEAYTGVKGMDLKVMDRKINTFSGQKKGTSPDEYVAPVALSLDERQILQKQARQALELREK